MTIKQIRTILLVIILGAACGLLLVWTVQFYNAELQEAELDDLHVLTPNGLKVIDNDNLTKTEVSKVEIKYQSTAGTEFEIVKYLLLQEELVDHFKLDDTGRDFHVYILSTVDNEQLLKNVPADSKYTRTPGFIASGNYLYLTKDFSKQIPNPLSAYHSVWGGFEAMRLFNSFSNEQRSDFVKSDSGYELEEVELVKEYAKLTKGDLGNWVNPYPSKTKEYEAVAPTCAELKSYIHLLICELNVFQSAKATLLPPASQKFTTDNYKLGEQAALSATETVQGNDISALINDIGLTTSAVKFTAWDIPTFSSPTFQSKADNHYYQNVDDSKLKTIREKITAAGWKESGISEKIADDQFKAETYKITFEKDNPLQKAQLTILVMDTKSLQVDCILEGVGIVYCDQKASITKNTGYYVQLALGQYAKYTITN